MASLELVLDQVSRPRAVTARTVAHCERCGAEAKVKILKDYAAGSRVMKRLCLSCADRMLDDELAGSRGVTSWFGPTAGVIAGLIALAVKFVY